jgi:beta-galactosidase GanA
MTTFSRRAMVRGALVTSAGVAAGGSVLTSPARAATGVADTIGPAHPGDMAVRTGAVTFDQYSLLINRERLVVWSGEFHPFRLPSPALWRDILQKMKASGFNAVCVYFNWSYHSPAQGVYDFTGVRDMDLFLRMAADEGLYVLARPGPYINGELNAGGFPGWLTASAGKARYDDATYLAAVGEWFTAINGILKNHQVTDGTGSLLLYQIENEYASEVPPTTAGTTHGTNYLAYLYAKARTDGITVPIYHNDKGRHGYWVPGSFTGSDSDYLYAFDGYPSAGGTPPDWGYYGTGGATGGSTASPATPGFMAEFGGGWFDPWGGAPWAGAGYGYERTFDGPAYERRFYLTNIANGIKIHNIYMAFGGTSWGWLPAPVVYTSYDYGAAISEPRQLTAKIPPLKQIGYFLQSVPDVAKLSAATTVTLSNTSLKAYHLANPDTGTEIYLIRNDHTVPLSTTFPVKSYTVPQAGAFTVAAKDAKLVLAHYTLGTTPLVYTTSHLMTHTGDLAVLTGPAGDSGETVLNYAERVVVTGALGSNVLASYDPTTGDLLISYTHQGLNAVTVTPQTGSPLTLLIADDDTAATIWRDGDIIVAGPVLLRRAEIRGHTVSLTGDTSAATDIQVLAPAGVTDIQWNGRRVKTTAGVAGALAGSLDGPPAVTLPDLTDWRYATENPESDPGFDDSKWTAASATTSNSITAVPSGQPVLFADDYGFHYGDVWYRGFWSGATGTSVSLTYQGGTVGCLQAWLDGVYLGFSQLPTPTTPQANTGLWSATATFDIPAILQLDDNNHFLAVLVRPMSHQEDGGANDAFKAAQGLVEVTFGGGAAPSVLWKITGADPQADTVRGPLNGGGLYGERNGWALPGFRDGDWARVTLPTVTPENGSAQAGVAWYRTRFHLDIPQGVDASLGLTITDDPSKQYRALIFLNGWNLGQYINDVGPQHTFALPAGILRTENVLALAVTGPACDLGTVTLTNLGTVSGGAH